MFLVIATVCLVAFVWIVISLMLWLKQECGQSNPKFSYLLAGALMIVAFVCCLPFLLVLMLITMPISRSSWYRNL
jgi:hypothetical protein